MTRICSMMAWVIRYALLDHAAAGRDHIGRIAIWMNIKLSIEEDVLILMPEITVVDYDYLRQSWFQRIKEKLEGYGTPQPDVFRDNEFSIQTSQDPWEVQEPVETCVVGILKDVGLDPQEYDRRVGAMRVEDVVRFVLSASQQMMLARAISPDRMTSVNRSFLSSKILDSGDRVSSDLFQYLHRRKDHPTLQLDLASVAAHYPVEFDEALFTLLKIMRVHGP